MMLLASVSLLLTAAADGDAAEPTIAGHTVKLDSQGKIIPWYSPAEQAYKSAWALDAGGRNGKMKARKSLEWFQAQRIREMPGYWRGSYRAGLAEDESLLIRAEPSSLDGVLRSVPHPTSFTSTALALVR